MISKFVHTVVFGEESEGYLVKAVFDNDVAAKVYAENYAKELHLKYDEGSGTWCKGCDYIEILRFPILAE